MASNSYSNESIKALSTRDSVRLRPDVWLQGHDLNAVKHTLVEILGNSVDEMKYCIDKRLPCLPKIEVTRYSDRAMSVKDYGRGIPVDFNTKEGKYNYELIFMVPFAGGKYDDSNGYEDGFTVGMNGVGLTVTQYTSEYLEAMIRRDGKEYKIRFKDGYLVDEMTSEETNTLGAGTTGSFIKWKPSAEVFTDIEIEDSYFDELLKGISIASNVNIEFFDEITGISKSYKGISYTDHFRNITNPMSLYETFSQSGKVSDERDATKNIYNYAIEGIVAFTDKPVQQMYHNMIAVSNGIHGDALLSALYRAINKEIDEKVYKSECTPLLNFVSVFLITKSTKTSYDGQAKRSVLNAGLRKELESLLTDTLTKLLAKSKEVKDLFLRIIKLKKKSEEDMQKIEKTTQKMRKAQDKIYQVDDNEIDKFVDCTGFSNTELYIVEGDSALGSCKVGRNSTFQAITAIRGKILNCLKQPHEQIAGNDIIIRLMKILGEKPAISGINVPSMRKHWEKIIICTDADDDGYQIRTLILTFFYVVYPQILEDGRVYIVESPLFQITTSKGEIMYAYTVEEKDELLERLEEQGIKVSAVARSKGLGENDPKMMWDTTMNPETRKLTQVQYSSDDMYSQLTDQMFNALLGDDLESRKELISDFMSNNPFDLEEMGA